jgi:hypothetical protein
MKKAALFATIIAATLATGTAAYAGGAHITVPVPDPARVVTKILHLTLDRHNGTAVRTVHYRGHRHGWRHGRYHRGHGHYRGHRSSRHHWRHGRYHRGHGHYRGERRDRAPRRDGGRGRGRRG